MDVTKPYEFIGFGAMDVTKPYEFIWFYTGREKSGIFGMLLGPAGCITVRVARPEWFYTPPGPGRFRNI